MSESLELFDNITQTVYQVKDPSIKFGDIEQELQIFRTAGSLTNGEGFVLEDADQFKETSTFHAAIERHKATIGSHCQFSQKSISLDNTKSPIRCMDGILALEQKYGYNDYGIVTLDKPVIRYILGNEAVYEQEGIVFTTKNEIKEHKKYGLPINAIRVLSELAVMPREILLKLPDKSNFLTQEDIIGEWE